VCSSTAAAQQQSAAQQQHGSNGSSSIGNINATKKKVHWMQRSAMQHGLRCRPKSATTKRRNARFKSTGAKVDRVRYDDQSKGESTNARDLASAKEETQVSPVTAVTSTTTTTTSAAAQNQGGARALNSIDRNVETTSNNVGNKTQYSKMAVVIRGWRWPSDKRQLRLKSRNKEMETETENHLKTSYRQHTLKCRWQSNDWR